MPDENTGQGTEAAPAPTDAGQGAEAPRTIQVGDQSFTEENLIKSFQEGQRKISEMGTKNSDLSTKLTEYQGWADPIRDRYNVDDGYRQGLDALYESQGQQAPVSQDNQRLLDLEMKIARKDQEDAFKDLRAEGFDVSKQDEDACLNEIASNTAITDAKLAYKHLFFNRELTRSAKGATSATAQKMAENQESYTQGPAGGTPAGPAAEDVKELYRKDEGKFEDAVIERLRKSGDWGT